MYKVIEDEIEIKKHQNTFERALQVDAYKYENKKIGFHGGSKTCDIF
jgi:hypothetical protein